MTNRTRYFLAAAVAILVVGVGSGLVAYLRYSRAATGVPAGLPAEVRYVPANAEMVAFANVKQVLNSDLHRQLMPSIDPESRKGRQMMNDFAGVDLEKQVDHVVMYAEPFIRADRENSEEPQVPHASLLVRGSFDQARIEQFIRDRGGVIEEYNGRKISVHPERREQIAVGFVGADLIAIGSPNLVRRAIDLSRSPADFKDVTTNAEMMNLMRDMSGSTAWAVGQFDAVSRQMRLPSAVTGQVPPVRLVSAKAEINGGIKATIRAETGDKAAADQLRDVVRGFIALARVQASGKGEFENALKSIELSGTDRTVRMTFAMKPETLRALAPARRGRGPSAPDAPPTPPSAPAPRNGEPLSSPR
jgi:hypothetical protein